MPLDGSANSGQIAKWTTSVARSINAEIIIVSVVRPRHKEEGDQDTRINEESLDEAIKRATQFAEGQAMRMKQAGIAASFISLIGDPAEEIINYSVECDASLIAMTTHRGSAIARGLLGSVTDRVVRGTDIPVLALHPESAETVSEDSLIPKTIVVPLDGSDRSASVVDIALDLTKSVDAKIVFLCVLSSSAQSFAPGASFISSPTSSAQRASAEKSLGTYVAKAEALGIDGRSLIGVGTPADEIVNEAKKWPNPMIIMSTRGQTGIKRWVLGSVTDKVMRSSGIPVLIVPTGN